MRGSNSNGQQQQPVRQASYKYGKSRKYHVKSINNTNLQPNGHCAPPALSHMTISLSLSPSYTSPSLSFWANQTSQIAAAAATTTTASTKGQIDNHNFIALSTMCAVLASIPLSLLPCLLPPRRQHMEAGQQHLPPLSLTACATVLSHCSCCSWCCCCCQYVMLPINLNLILNLL